MAIKIWRAPPTNARRSSLSVVRHRKSSSPTSLPSVPSISKGRNHALRRYCRAIRREEGVLNTRRSPHDATSHVESLDSLYRGRILSARGGPLAKRHWRASVSAVVGEPMSAEEMTRKGYGYWWRRTGFAWRKSTLYMKCRLAVTPMRCVPKRRLHFFNTLCANFLLLLLPSLFI